MDAHIKIINESISSRISGRKDKVFILEAGCGSASWFDIGANADVVGVDISWSQLYKNKTLDHKILGDIVTLGFKPASFDVIICCDVLEHVKRPELAIANFCNSLKDGGIIVILVPNVLSLKGLATKFTPMRFHQWVYKKIYRYKSKPFPTYCRFAISPGALRRFAKSNNLDVYWESYRLKWIQTLRTKSTLFHAIYVILGLLLKVLTIGAIAVSETEFVIVYKKAGMPRSPSVI